MPRCSALQCSRIPMDLPSNYLMVRRGLSSYFIEAILILFQRSYFIGIVANLRKQSLTDCLGIRAKMTGVLFLTFLQYSTIFLQALFYLP